MGKKMEFPSANSKISTSLHEENINTPDIWICTHLIYCYIFSAVMCGKTVLI